MAKNTHAFELLAIDLSGKSEITTVKSMAMGLSYSEKLWKKPTVKATSIEDKGLGITLSIHKAGEVEDDSEAAFIIKAKCTQLDKADEFRYGLLHHIKDKLEFSNIRVLKDSVSEHLAQNIYLTLTEAESVLRTSLAHHFMQQHGLNWWNEVAPKSMISKVNSRKDTKGVYTEMIDNDIIFTDYEDLTALAKKAYSDKKLHDKLEALSDVKHKIGFNNIFEKEDLEEVEKLVAEATKLLTGQEPAKPTPKPAKKVAKKPAAKKEAKPEPKKATTKTPSRPAAKPAPKPVVEKTPEPVVETATPKAVETAPVVEAPKPEPVKESKPDYNDDAFMMITENKLLDELKSLEAVQSGEINIKNFVKDVLAKKGYMSGPAFGLAESMKDKGLVNIYESKDDKGFMIKVIKSN